MRRMSFKTSDKTYYEIYVPAIFSDVEALAVDMIHKFANEKPLKVNWEIVVYKFLHASPHLVWEGVTLVSPLVGLS